MKQQQLAVSKNNLIWLVIIIVVGVLAWQVFGWIVGLVAIAATLLVSEAIERRRRGARRSDSS